MALRTIPSAIQQQAALQALRGPQISPLDAIMGGVQQGLQLQQLPQQLQDQELARQLNNALLAQKLQDLQNPNAAISREFQRQLVLSSLNPATGITVAQPGAETLTVATPSAIGQTEAALDQALALNPSLTIPTAAPGAPITPIINPITGRPTGLVRDTQAARQLQEQSLNDKIALANARLKQQGISGEFTTDVNGNSVFLQKPTAGSPTPTAIPTTTATGETFKPAPKATSSQGKQVLIKDQESGVIKNVLLKPGDEVPEGFSLYEKVKATASSDPLKFAKQVKADPAVKDFSAIRSQYSRMLGAIEESKTTSNFVAVDQSLINAFNKILDPSSVVRESEYARTARDISLLNQIRGKFEKLQSGGAGLTDDERQAMIKMAERFYNASRQNFDETVNYYTPIAESLGLDPELVIPNLNLSSTSGSVSSPVATPGINPRGTNPVTPANLLKKHGL